MSNLDFEISEFEDRQQRTRAAMEKIGIDLLIVTNPVNINYLAGSRIKGYQEFQALLFTLEPSDLILQTRFADVFEAQEMSLSGDVRGWDRDPGDHAVPILKSILEEKGYLNRRIGLEVPNTYLNVHDYLQLREVLGDALVAEPTRLIEELKFVKSPAELAYIRKASDINDAVHQTCLDIMAAGKTEFQVVGEMHRTMMSLGGEFTSSPMNFVSGERTPYSHGFPLGEGASGRGPGSPRIRFSLSPVHLHHWSGDVYRGADGQDERGLPGCPGRLRRDHRGDQGGGPGVGASRGGEEGHRGCGDGGGSVAHDGLRNSSRIPAQVV